MAKDPAFLFYYQDFLVGTDDLTNEQIGAYIRCLCIQAAKGGISEEHMKKICLRQEITNTVKSKFIWHSEDNVFRNERLHKEVEKRKMYCESRRSNRKSNPNISQSYVPHMENENEDINTDIITNGERKKTKRSRNHPASGQELYADLTSRRKSSINGNGKENT